MADSMRMRLTDARERRIERLKEATGENSKSGAIDVAAKFYLNMAAVDYGERVGNVPDLLDAAAERGSLTAPEIAAILDSPQLELDASTSYSIGD